MKGYTGRMILSVYTGDSIDYDTALRVQQKLHSERLAEKTGDCLLLQEHPPTLTIGRNGKQSDILLDADALQDKGITVRRTSRGGDVTYHGPGQLVAYPIIHLYAGQRSLRAYVERLEQVIMDMLAVEFNITASRDTSHRGVWIGDRKIAAVGISVAKAVTMHGLAFNVQPDLSCFEWIVPCGITDREVTSLARELPGVYSMEKIRELFIRHFCLVFSYAGFRLHDYKELF
ncbi:MAG: lipoyl(octanoyl) transferase LipB [Spirochaetales bacterium]|nr:lipoyl(octanoyl) transferase LipB [Spirochaetales bacterium]